MELQNRESQTAVLWPLFHNPGGEIMGTGK